MDSIELLNGERFTKDEILKLMESDDFYYDYLGKAALSSSSIKLLLDSPKKYKYIMEYGSPSTQGLRDGWLFHACILEPKLFEEQIFVDVQSGHYFNCALDVAGLITCWGDDQNYSCPSLDFGPQWSNGCHGSPGDCGV